ncbi:iron ABC transporter permease [Paenibacillus sp. L3-i20]|uniref:ABC transporter permease n=1 Tax=Paenibacillus sp. L3-i20 TaxID=2905833 RepID=UPI001EDDECFE|nr:iron ABC transporter permease [Paenibacillus sp. L3-i20]GKU77068.1 iron ABC transporter permease [Paenibacillus sp. L3-i20]
MNQIATPSGQSPPKTVRTNPLKKLARDPILLATIIFVIVSLFIFVVLPLIEVLKQSFIASDGSFTLKAYVSAFTSTSNFTAITNTLLLATIVGVLATLIGFMFAYAGAYIRLPGKKLFNLIAMLPIISPPFAVALSTILLFGSRGLISHDLLGIDSANIYGLKGLIFVQTLSFFPIAYLLLNGVMRSIDPSIEEAARNLGASRWNTFSKVTLPLVKPAISNAFLLVFIKSIADFGNPITIGGDYTTLATQIYLQAIGNYDMQGAAAMAVILLDISIILFIISKYYLEKKTFITVTGKSSRDRVLIGERHIALPISIFCLSISTIVLLLYALIPLGSFVKLWGIDYSFTFDHYIYAFEIGKKALLDTTVLSLIAMPITGVLGMIIAYLLVRKKFFGKTFIDFTTMLSIGVPGTVIGIGFVLAFNSAPLALTGTAAILVIAFVSRSLPVGIKAGQNSLRQIDPSIEEAAMNLGANSFKVFTSVTLPLIKTAFFGGLVYSFIKSMTSMSAIIFLISAKYKLLTISILDQVESGKFGAASAFSTILVIIVYIVIFFLYRLIALLGVKKKDISM